MSLEEKLEGIFIEELDCADCKKFFDYVNLRIMYYKENLKIRIIFESVFTKEKENFSDKDIFLAYIQEDNKNIIVGYVIGSVYKDSITFKKSYRSHHVYVHPDYRNMGIAKLLKQRQIQRAKSLECSKIVTYVDKNNVFSLKLQESLGAKMKPDSFGNSYSVIIEL